MADYDAFASDYDLGRAGGRARRRRRPRPRETGKRVIGIDRSTAMMAIGRERAGDLPVDFREGDMRELALDEQVELVVSPARAFQHVPTWADRPRTMERIAAALRPGEALYGWLDGRPYDDASTEMVWVARKPA